MPREIHRHERKPSFRVPCPHQPRASIIGERNERRIALVHVIGVLAQLRVVGHVEILCTARLGLEALLAVPGHVLNRDERAVGEEEEVEQAVAHEHVVGAVDHGGEGAEPRGDGLVAVREEIGATAADGVVGGRGVYHFLDVGAVEVVIRAAGEGWEACG